MTQSICLIDTSKCIGCRGCQAACKQWNQLPADETSFTGSYENPPRFSHNTWLRVAFREDNEGEKRVDWMTAELGCMHCTDAGCMQACPAGAIYCTDFGTVNIDEVKCIGCNYCTVAGPFKVIGFDRCSNKTRKFTYCNDRLSNGLTPACAKACPARSITFGDRRELINRAMERVDQLQAAGATGVRIYGLDEADETAMFYVLADVPDK